MERSGARTGGQFLCDRKGFIWQELRRRAHQIVEVQPMTVEERLEKIEAKLDALLDRDRVREWYSVEEVARIAGRAPFTVREWARHGRIKAERKESGRGAYRSYAISHEELLRFQREGLLPVRNSA
jgi:hypothetical protein